MRHKATDTVRYEALLEPRGFDLFFRDMADEKTEEACAAPVRGSAECGTLSANPQIIGYLHDLGKRQGRERAARAYTHLLFTVTFSGCAIPLAVK